MKNANRVIALLVVFLLVALAGCGEPGGTVTQGTAENQPTNTQPLPSEPIEKKVVTVGVYYTAHMRNTSAWLQAAQTVLQEKYPDVVVKIERYETKEGGPTFDDLSRSFALNLMAGKAPDVMIFSPHLLNNPSQAIQEGYFEDMAPFFDQNPDFPMHAFYKPIMDVGVAEGKRYALPVSFVYQPMITTQEMADQIGYSPENQFTLEEWMKLAVKTREDQGVPLLYSRLWMPVQHLYFLYILASGCPVPFDVNTQEVHFDSPQFREALEFVRELALHQGEYIPFPGEASEAFAQHGGVVWEGFEGTRAIPYEVTDYFFRNLSDPDQTVIPLNYPVMDGSAGDIGVVDLVLAVSANSKEKDAAMQVCAAMVDTQAQATGLLESEMASVSYFPQVSSNKEAMAEYVRKTQLASDLSKDFRDQYLECLNHVERGILFDSILLEIINSKIAQYFEGEISHEELIGALNQKVGLYLKE